MVATKRLFFSATFLLSLTLVLAGFAGCGSENPGASEDSALGPGVSRGDADVQDPSYNSSITVPEDTDDNQLSGLAEITSEEAEASALAQVPGTVIESELENENGNVVYAVEIDTGSGAKEVKVDAGNGMVLHIDADDDESDEIKGAEEDEPGGLESDHEFEGEEEGEH
jgi:hypothetical protein